MSAPIDPSSPDDCHILRALARFDEASLELLKARALLRRVDRKYLLSTRTLNEFLAQLGADYVALQTAGHLAPRYHTVYYDTPDRRSYEDHRRGRFPRFKVRARDHVDRGMSFVEIKRKGADGRTVKSVLSRPFGTGGLDAEALAFIRQHCPLDPACLVRSLTVEFRRATLVNVRMDERLTIDVELQLSDERQRLHLPRVAIVEIKQGRFSNQTPAVRALRALHVRERSVSKYCLGTARLAAVRSNSFRPALFAVERLSA